MLAFKEDISIPANGVRLEGELIIPEECDGLVIFSHGSGSSRHSSRNKFVAGKLQEVKMATLLFDLLSEEEDLVRAMRFDIELLTQRLIKATQYVGQLNETHRLPIAYFGASTGAASALKAAARQGEKISAVISRGGRPDLAMDEIDQVSAASLFIVGGEDHPVIQYNEQAFSRLQCEKREMKIVPGATHLFEEPGTLEKVASLAADWYKQHLTLS